MLGHGHTAFLAIFLLTHGLVKVVRVLCLLCGKLWAYPFALITLGPFIACQLYRIAVKLTLGMTFLTILDAVTVWLIWREWEKQHSLQSDM